VEQAFHPTTFSDGGINRGGEMADSIMFVEHRNDKRDQ
jgi:hypothetical protein